MPVAANEQVGRVAVDVTITLGDGSVTITTHGRIRKARGNPPPPPPTDPDPTWYGHSVGRFEGDTLVIDTVGFNDRFWFDFAGHPHTEQLHTIERYRRPEFGRLLYEVTIDDPGAYTRPFTLYGEHAYESSTELMEYICNENNQDVEHIVGKDPRNKYTKP